MSNLKLIDVEVQEGVRLSSAPALFLQNLDTLVIADIHWGYAVSQRDRGRMVPLWGDENIADRLHAVIDQFSPSRLVLLGDIVHDAPGTPEAMRVVTALSGSLSATLVGGNHDLRSPLETVESIRLGDFFLHHGDQPLKAPEGSQEIIGHLHPAAVWRDGAGTRIKMPALVASPARIVLPAFSPWTKGVAWRPNPRAGERLWMISPRRIFPISTG